MHICPVCNSSLVEQRDDMVRTITHNEVIYSTNLVNCVCSECGVDYCVSAQIDENYERWVTLCESIPDYISPSNILKVREIYDLSLSDAASYFGVSRDQWRIFERGESHPDLQLTNDLKRATVDVDFFIDKILDSRPLKKP